MIHRNEYKRRQAAPGVKITVKAFGKDRRLPITNGTSPNSRDATPMMQRVLVTGVEATVSCLSPTRLCFGGTVASR